MCVPAESPATALTDARAELASASAALATHGDDCDACWRYGPHYCPVGWPLWRAENRAKLAVDFLGLVAADTPATR